MFIIWSGGVSLAEKEYYANRLVSAVKHRQEMVNLLSALETLKNPALVGFVVKSEDKAVMFEVHSYESWVDEGEITLEELDVEIKGLRKRMESKGWDEDGG